MTIETSHTLPNHKGEYIMQKKFKLAFIGAGSIGFTRGLLSDILSVPEFSEIEVSFMDINPNNLGIGRAHF